MAINDDLYWYKNVLKRTISTTIRFYLSISIILSPIVLMTEARADWNDGATSEIRQKIASNNIYGPDAGRITVRNYDRTAKMVNASLSASADVAGSKATATAQIKLPASAAKTASVSLKRFAKGGIAGMLGGAALQAFIDSVGWVIDEGSKTIKKPVSSTEPETCYVGSSNTTCEQQCKSYVNWTFGSLRKSGTGAYCVDTRSVDYAYISNATFVQKTNVTQETVSESELASEIQKSMNANDGKADNLISSAYQAVDALGNATEDLNKAVDGLNDAVKDLTDAMNDILKSSDPVGTGKTDTIPSITYNNTTITNNSTTTNNTTNETTTTMGTSELKIPAFCDWASIMCKWIDWTQEEPEKKDPEKVEFDDDASAGKVTLTGSDVCPQDSVEFTVLGKTYTYQLPYQPVCDALSFFKPAVLAVGAITSAFIVAGINVKGED
ncbi:virulence factor TspB C-terminal domain-related protein [Acinetobacter pittii]|uniref:virulence factor TspB C-terminal domain-related protein n=1 Tax=Acinetobacter pittii TaxID=48296 RepID=UPI0005C5FACB|nr:virulence factor TspB C-terminal domain-related protein [Acinetobacter pittii]